MIEPVSTGAAIVGIGWAGKKILGPSLDELGQQLKIYAGRRIEKIFEKTDQLAAAPALLNQVPPAFALKFFQSASLSEDEEIITDLWANLLINSSKEFNHRYVLYLDILEKLSAEDALILNEIIPPGIDTAQQRSVQWQLNSMRQSLCWNAERILNDKGITHFDVDSADKFDGYLSEFKSDWPVRVLASIIPHIPANGPLGNGSASSAARGWSNSEAPYDNLMRQRLLQSFEVSFIAGFQTTVAGIMATALGVEFIESCRGKHE
jgi:Abortive infection alpha